MPIIKFLIDVITLSLLFAFLIKCKDVFIKIKKPFVRECKFLIFRITRISRIKKTPHYVWIDLVEYLKKSDWKFSHDDKDKQIVSIHKVNRKNYVHFEYKVTHDELIFKSTILSSFDEYRASDILILASHLNNSLSFGVIKVNLKFNYVELVHYGNLLTYSIYAGEIGSDIDKHFKLTRNCVWTFNSLLESDEDPLIIFSEYLKRRNK